MNATVKLRCAGCGVQFFKEKREYTRQKKRANQSRFYCTQSCQVSSSNFKSPRGDRSGKWLVPGNRRDEFTPFRWYIIRIKQRPQKGPSDVTLKSLRALWDKQSGICPITGWKLRLPNGTDGWKEGPSTKNASIDRIDNSKGYLDGNIRFVSVMANLARGRFDDSELEEFCIAVAGRRQQLDGLTEQAENREEEKVA